MAAISDSDIARAIYLLSRGKSRSEQIAISRKIVKFLFRRRLLHKVSGILSQLRKIIDQEEDRITAKVKSAKALNHQTKARLGQSLKKRYSAKEIVFAESLDSRLLGGLKIEVNNEIIDLSIKNKIEKLQEHLMKSV